MRLSILVFLLSLVVAHGKEEAKTFGTVHLYGFMSREWLPFANAELLSVRPGLIRFRSGSQEFEHSGRFTVEQPAPPKKEKKWWQFGDAANPERVDMVLIYGYATFEMMPFRSVEIYDKREGFIVFEAGGVRYTHGGRYSIRR